jgi:hypothetical protein
LAVGLNLQDEQDEGERDECLLHRPKVLRSGASGKANSRKTLTSILSLGGRGGRCCTVGIARLRRVVMCARLFS